MSVFEQLKKADRLTFDGKTFEVVNKDWASLALRDESSLNIENFHRSYIDSARAELLTKKEIKATNIIHIELTKEEKRTEVIETAIAMALRQSDRPFGLTGENDKDRSYNGQIIARRTLDELGFHDEPTPDKSKLCRIQKRFISSKGDVAAAIADKRGHRGKGIGAEREEIIKQAIEDHYFKLNKSTKQSTLEYAKRLAPSHLKDAITYSTVSRRIDERREDEIILYRQGVGAFKQHKRSTGKKFKVKHVMDRVEVDAVHLTLAVVDQENRFLGYCTIYFVIDCKTRCILGYFLEVKKKLSGETRSGVFSSLLSMLVDDAPPDAAYKYAMCGSPIFIFMDQGSAYKNKSMVKLLDALNIGYKYSKTRQGWGKPFVESFNKFLRTRFGQNIEAYRKPEDARKAIRERPEFQSAVYIDELRNALGYFIHHCYHNKKHEGLKLSTPKKEWEKHYPAKPPLQAEKLDLLYFKGETGEYALYPTNGIRLLYQEFYSPELRDLYDALNLKRTKTVLVNIRYDQNDASAINVYNPLSKEWIHVPNKDDEIGIGVSFTEANAEREANKDAHNEEKPFFSEDHFTPTRVKKGKHTRPHDEVPSDDGQTPVSEDELFDGIDYSAPAKPLTAPEPDFFDVDNCEVE